MKPTLFLALLLTGCANPTPPITRLSKLAHVPAMKLPSAEQVQLHKTMLYRTCCSTCHVEDEYNPYDAKFTVYPDHTDYMVSFHCRHCGNDFNAHAYDPEDYANR